MYRRIGAIGDLEPGYCASCGADADSPYGLPCRVCRTNGAQDVDQESDVCGCPTHRAVEVTA